MMFIFSLFFFTTLGAPAGDLITNLPGQPHVSFKQYAGYVDVNASPQRSLFYWFIEHESSPSTAPIIVWLQGGPGCSSMMGLFTENGPWRVMNNGKLAYDIHSWNKQANMLYIDSPAGVGFSYDLSAPVPTTGDNQTMADLYTFLSSWYLQKFPEFVGNDLYIAGESYGGHYVPQLTWTLLNAINSGASTINLKGMLVGNPWTDDDLDGNAVPEFIYSHALCSLDIWQAVQKECGFFKMPDVRLGHRDHLSATKLLSALRPTTQSAKCDAALNQLGNEMGPLINQYDIYVNCEKSGGGLPCMNYDALINYLTSPSVTTALHIRSQANPWAVCTGNINYAESWPSVVPIYPQIIKQLPGRVMVYSGDVTFNCGFVGSQRWIQTLKMPKVSGWNNFVVNNQAGGYHSGYGHGNNTEFHFVTIRNAGHMTPQYQPLRSFVMLKNFLANKWN